MAFIPYAASRKSLYHPGEADDFFRLGPIRDHAALCAEMSRLAYVKDETRLRLYLGRIGYSQNLAFGYVTDGTQGFVASNQDDHVTVVAFRGTEPDDSSDLFTNANVALTPWTDDAGRPLGKVHEGFAAALQKTGILAHVKSCLELLAPSTRVLLTGHSLGAALATLLSSRIPSAHLYTYGSCRVGDAAFAQAMQAASHTRFINCCDLVTRVPPATLGYVHAGSPQYIDRNGRLLGSPSENEVNADRLKGAAWYFVRYALLPGTVFSRNLADHAPINYVSAAMGLRLPE